jgi:hypothetical protein
LEVSANDAAATRVAFPEPNSVDSPVQAHQQITTTVDADGKVELSFEVLSSDPGLVEAVGIDNLQVVGTGAGWSLNAIQNTDLLIAPAYLLANDSDIDNGILNIANNGFTIGTGTESVTVDGNGNLLFTPTDNHTGLAEFTYTLSDGQGGSDTATVTLWVDPESVKQVGEADNIQLGSGQFLFSDGRVGSDAERAMEIEPMGSETYPLTDIGGSEFSAMITGKAGNGSTNYQGSDPSFNDTPGTYDMAEPGGALPDGTDGF